NGVANRVAEVQDLPKATLGFVVGDDVGLYLAAARDDIGENIVVQLQQARQIAFQAIEERGVVNNSVFDDLREAGAEFASGQGRENLEIAQDQTRLVKGADQIFSGLEVDADFAADGAVHLREQRGGHLDKRDAAQIGGRNKTSQVSDHAPAEGEDAGLAFEPMARKGIVTILNDFEALGA